jgi:hypothetical protein
VNLSVAGGSDARHLPANASLEESGRRSESASAFAADVQRYLKCPAPELGRHDLITKRIMWSSGSRCSASQRRTGRGASWIGERASSTAQPAVSRQKKASTEEFECVAQQNPTGGGSVRRNPYGMHGPLEMIVLGGSATVFDAEQVGSPRSDALVSPQKG